MVGNILTVIVLLIAFVYAILGGIISSKLSKIIQYEGSYLSLWNQIQLEVLLPSSKSQLNTELSQRTYRILRKLIIYFYSLFIPFIFALFISDFLEI